MAWCVGKDRISCMHQGGHGRDMQGQDRTLRTAVPGKGPNHSGDQIPTSQCGHQALYPSRVRPARGCFVHRTNPYQGHHWPIDQWSLWWRLAKESLQLRTYGPAFCLPGCGWTPTTGPALAAGLYARPICWVLSCRTEVHWHVPQRLEHWNVCQPFRVWLHAFVLHGTCRPMTAALWPTYPSDVWPPWKPIWDLPGPCMRSPQW